PLPSLPPFFTLSLHDALPISSPVFPPGNSTNAPKFLIPVTFPTTLLPTSTDILIYYPPNYHLLSLYNNTIKKKNNHYNIVTIILDRKSTRLNSSHVSISYAVF